ncbi:MAG TPA: DNA methyltransferase [Methylomirabilota bacterium]|nr:DNA methyltransferase [Methylomirabilota bacterium]
MNIQGNGIYQSDCLVLLERIESEQLSMAYLDPPAFTQITKTPINKDENEVEETKELMEHLSLITKVFQQIHRILNARGNLFFHTEPYLAGDYRRILNQVFGRKNFRLEIILPKFRTNITRSSGPRMEHDTVLHYSRGDNPIYNPEFKQLKSDNTYSQTDERGKYKLVSLTKRISRPSLQFEWNSFMPPPEESWIYSKERLDELNKKGRISHRFQGQRPRLKVYLDELHIEVGSIWDDISSVSTHSKESLSFQAQKPLILLNRLIKMGSNPGDLVLDPFFGSGTSLISAQLNGRRWLGCDISTEAYSIAMKRVENEFKFQANVDFSIGDQYLLEQNFPVIHGIYNETVRDFDKQVHSIKFIVNQPISIEETRHNEFKEIESTTNPINKIKEQVDEYAIAFLNSEGGQILWGIRDGDRTISGVKLNYKQRDEVRRVVKEKLLTIQPPITTTAFDVELHQVYQGTEVIPDLYVVQLVVPAVSNRSLYYTSSGKAFVRTDGANKELKGPLLQAEILKRFSIQQQ